jgi:hypothetical protein
VEDKFLLVALEVLAEVVMVGNQVHPQLEALILAAEAAAEAAPLELSQVLMEVLEL